MNQNSGIMLLLYALTSGLLAADTTFTYEGRLDDGGHPATGLYDLTFSLFGASSGGSQIGTTITRSDTGVTNGLFIARLNFGAAVFTGADRWLEIGVRTNGESTFTPLDQRQQVTPTPYTITAFNLSGTVSPAQISGTISGAQISPGTIGAGQLGDGAAAANLQGSGLSGVPRGGMILSSNSYDANLGNAGYVRLGRVDLGDAWTQRASGSPPAAREGHTAVWTGSEMLVWGGYNGNDFDDGARYNPAANSWTAITTVGAPAARDSHSAVWTGTEMIIWGGYDASFLPFSDGGLYSPASDSWNAVTTVDAPAARGSHTAVWTGTEMIVWGGLDGSTSLNDGGRYNPGANSWNATPLSLTGAPTSRSAHTAVWNGTEMIIWGGTPDGSSFLNTGARYNASANNWSAVATIDAPPPRAEHTAVWTGSKMLIWGGGDGTAALNSGGRYDPASDSWNSVAMAGSDAPSARSYHSAVWTGTEMMIWGGIGSSAILSDGGRYHPGANSWTPITTSGAPGPRAAHTAIWTGNEMIVWGGSPDFGTSFLNDGGR